MTSNARIAQMVSVLVISTAAILNSADLSTNQPDGLTVHEWGTFTSVAGEDGSAIEWNLLGGKDDLPGFVYNRGTCVSTKFGLSGTVRMETPVLYFYSPVGLDAHVRVVFPKGLITEWYPHGEYQINQQSGSGGSGTSLTRMTGGIEWRDVKIEPNTAPSLPLEDKPSRYYAARATEAAPITVGNQHEKFLFYRGIGHFAVPLSAALTSGGNVVVTNLGSDPFPVVMLFENRGGHLGYRNAGTLSGSITLSQPSLNGSLPQLQHDLENALTAQGLFPKEAAAMVATWQDSWFEEGARLIYIVPSRALDSLLPLQVDPPPSQTARVFVGRIELITSETKRTVEQAMAAKDDSVIARYGRFLDPILTRISAEKPAIADQIEQFRAHVQSAFVAAPCR